MKVNWHTGTSPIQVYSSSTSAILETLLSKSWNSFSRRWNAIEKRNRGGEN